MEMRGSCRGIGTTQSVPPANDIALCKDLADNRDRYIAQSILTSVLDTPYVPTIEEARDIIAWAGRRAS